MFLLLVKHDLQMPKGSTNSQDCRKGMSSRHDKNQQKVPGLQMKKKLDNKAEKYYYINNAEYNEWNENIAECTITRKKLNLLEILIAAVDYAKIRFQA